MFRVLILVLLFAVSASAKDYQASAWTTDAGYHYNVSAWESVTKNRYNGSSWSEIEAGVGGSVKLWGPDAYGDNFWNLYEVHKLAGNQITGLSASDTIESFKVYFGTIRASQTLTLRIATGTDLTSYSQTVDVGITTGDSNSWIEFIFPVGVTGSTSYYVGMISDNSTYANRVSLRYGSDATEVGWITCESTWDISGCSPSGALVADMEAWGTE